MHHFFGEHPLSQIGKSFFWVCVAFLQSYALTSVKMPMDFQLHEDRDKLHFIHSYQLIEDTQ